MPAASKSATRGKPGHGVPFFPEMYMQIIAIQGVKKIDNTSASHHLVLKSVATTEQARHKKEYITMNKRIMTIVLFLFR